MKVLITGSHGFVGTNLIRAFEGRHEVIRWDIRSNAPLPEVDAVVHLAGKAHDTKHLTQPDVYFQVNTELTKKIYEQFLQSSARRFIFFSSVKAQDADTPYAQSKLAAEQYLQERMPGQQPAQHTYILRPCLIYGPGNKANLKLLYQLVSKGLPWPLAVFDNRRSLVSVDNVAYVVGELLSQEVADGIYPVSDDEAVSTNELVSIICQTLHQPCRLWHVPKTLVRILARVGDVLHLPLNSERLRKLTEDYVVDNTKIKQALHISRMPVGIREGYASAINHMKNSQ